MLEALALLPSQKQRQTATGDTWQRRSSAPKHLLGGRKTSQVLPSRLMRLRGSARAFALRSSWLAIPCLFSQHASCALRRGCQSQLATLGRFINTPATCLGVEMQGKCCPVVPGVSGSLRESAGVFALMIDRSSRLVFTRASFLS